MITVIDLVKRYSRSDEPAAVDGVSFAVARGEFYTLLGPSGCGKTTTLRCIAGLERADSGRIELSETVVMSDRAFVPPHRRDVGMVFQSYAIWPHMNVFDNVAFPLRAGAKRYGRSEIRDRVERALALVGLEGLESRNATQLSGGQQQRVSLARAIVREPTVLLLDEPLSNLDARLRERMRTEVTLLQRRLGITTLFVTHDQVEALSMSDRIAVMDRGRIIQEGTPADIYQHPASQFVANFIGSTNLVEGHVSSIGDEKTSLVRTKVGELRVARSDLDLDISEGSSVLVAIRPEDINIHAESDGHGHADDEANVVVGRVIISLFTGAARDYLIDVNGITLQARASSRLAVEPGHEVRLVLPPDRCALIATTARFSTAQA